MWWTSICASNQLCAAYVVNKMRNDWTYMYLFGGVVSVLAGPFVGWSQLSRAFRWEIGTVQTMFGRLPCGADHDVQNQLRFIHCMRFRLGFGTVWGANIELRMPVGAMWCPYRNNIICAAEIWMDTYRYWISVGFSRASGEIQRSIKGRRGGTIEFRISLESEVHTVGCVC